MKYKLSIPALAVLILSFLHTSIAQTKDARKIINKVVKANGGLEALKQLKDVSYEYTFRSMEKGISDVSEERYIFDREISYAQYTNRQYYVLPDLKGKHTQYFNGTKTVSKIGESIIEDQKAAYAGHFFRKTNYYWFNMMFKLLDPGVQHKMLPPRLVDGIAYEIVEMTFGENVGESDDKYILYINPKTYRIDQFLFTVKGFGFTDPFLMKLQYEEINGIYVSTYRKYAPANWEGQVLKEQWNEQISKNIRFNNGFTVNNIKDTNPTTLSSK